LNVTRDVSHLCLSPVMLWLRLLFESWKVTGCQGWIRSQQNLSKDDGKHCILRFIKLLSWTGTKKNFLTSGTCQLYVFTKTLIKLTVAVIESYHCCQLHTEFWNRGSTGSIVSDYGLEDRAIGVRSPAGAKDSSSNLCVQTGSGAHPASCTIGTGGPFPGGKTRTGSDADHSPPSSAEV
jgi:hypothetical protein